MTFQPQPVTCAGNQVPNTTLSLCFTCTPRHRLSRLTQPWPWTVATSHSTNRGGSTLKRGTFSSTDEHQGAAGGLLAPTRIHGSTVQPSGAGGAEVLWLGSGSAASPARGTPLGRCGTAIQWQRGQPPAARKESYLVPCQSPWGTWREASDRSWLRKASPTGLALKYNRNPATVVELPR